MLAMGIHRGCLAPCDFRRRGKVERGGAGFAILLAVDEMKRLGGDKMYAPAMPKQASMHREGDRILPKE
jgi:hypothetical protein